MALRRPALASCLPARRSITTGLAANGRSKGLDSESSSSSARQSRDGNYRASTMMRTSPGPANVTVVMPALNEECTVGENVRALLDDPTMHTLPIARIIVVDNGSTDATAAVARAAGAQVVSEPRCGYGSACLAGVLQAEAGDVVLLMDADGSDDVRGAALVTSMVLAGEADLAMGSRTLGRSDPGALVLQQRVGNAVAAHLMRILCGVAVTDLGPTRAIRREVLLALGMSEMTYGWSTEMLVKATRAGYRLVETPVDYHPRRGGRSKVSGTVIGSIRAGWSILTTILRHARWIPEERLQHSPIPSGRRGVM